MGPGEDANASDLQNAYEMGKLIAQNQWVLLTGGRNVGVMDAAAQGAKQENGLTVAILPGETHQNMSGFVDIAIATGMGSARNNINVLSCDAIVVCGIGAGTASEIALALKANKKVILIAPNPSTELFFFTLSPQQILTAETPQTAVSLLHMMVSSKS